MIRKPSGTALIGILTLVGVGAAFASQTVSLRNWSTDRPVVLDQEQDYSFHNVVIAGMRDAAALTLTGRIHSLTISKSLLGNVRAGERGQAASLMSAGASVERIIATDSTFFDAETQVVSLRDGRFGLVRFERCTFRVGDEFLKRLYAENPWRNCPPLTEFHNIDRLELLDNAFQNTLVVIHPSVRQVVIRGDVKDLHIQDPDATQVIRLDPAGPKDAAVAMR